MTDVPGWLRPVATAADTVAVDLITGQAPAAPEGARPSAVLMLFGEGDDGPDLVITERSHTMRSHPGQLAFPGGAAEPGDRGPAETALREAHEEIGLDPTGVDVFGTLPAVWVPRSNFSVTVILGWWRVESPITVVDPLEVNTVLRVPLEHLLDPANRFTTVHPMGWRGPGFAVGDGLVLWGFTALIVNQLFELVGWNRPWDSSVERPVPVVGGAR